MLRSRWGPQELAQQELEEPAATGALDVQRHRQRDLQRGPQKGELELQPHEGDKLSVLQAHERMPDKRCSSERLRLPRSDAEVRLARSRCLAPTLLPPLPSMPDTASPGHAFIDGQSGAARQAAAIYRKNRGLVVRHSCPGGVQFGHVANGAALARSAEG